MAKKKQTKAEKAAKAKIQNNKMTVGKAGDIYALGAPALDGIFEYMESKNSKDVTIGIPLDYTGLNFETGEFNWERLVRGWGGTVNRAGEKGFFKFIGVKGPRSEIKTMGDVLDWATYFGNEGMWQYENPGATLKDRNRHAHYSLNGINLHASGLDAWDPSEMVMKKIVPYTIQKTLRKIPFVKRTFAKINKLF